MLAHPRPKVLPRQVVSLAGAVDLRLTLELGGAVDFANGGPAVVALMGGSPTQVPDRYSAANPGELLPLGAQQILIQGSDDDQIPPQLPHRWADAARRHGDAVEVNIIPGADHFDVVDPESRAWPVTQDALLRSIAP